MINKITAPLSTGPSVFAQPVLNQLAALLTDCNHGTRVSGGYVKAGSLWNIGGAMFLADSDTAITGTRSSSTTGIKFTVSGSTATASYGTDTPTWNASYQGYYDDSGNYYWRGIGPGSYTEMNYFLTKLVSAASDYTSGQSYKINKTGFYRIQFMLSVTISGTIYGKLYLNGSAYSTEHTSTSVSDVYVTEDLFFEEGDVLTIYAKGTGQAGFRVLSDNKGLDTTS